MAGEAAPNAAPAPAAPPNVLGGPALSHAAAAEKARGAITSPPPAAAASPPAPAAPAAAPTPGIKTEGADLKDLTRLSSENRALQQKVKELEPLAKDAALLKEVRDLYAAGKKVAAIGKLAGADPTQEMEGLLTDYLRDPNDATVQDKLAAKVEEVAKRIDDGEKQRQGSEQAAEHARAAHGVVDGQLTSRLDKLPYTAKADRGEAIGKVLSAVTRLRESKGLSIEASTPEVMQGLLADAIDEVEIEYEVRAARAARATAPVGAPPVPAAAAPAAAPPAIEGVERPGVTVSQWGKTLDHSAAREKMRAAMRAGTT